MITEITVRGHLLVRGDYLTAKDTKSQQTHLVVTEIVDVNRFRVRKVGRLERTYLWVKRAIRRFNLSMVWPR